MAQSREEVAGNVGGVSQSGRGTAGTLRSHDQEESLSSGPSQPERRGWMSGDKGGRAQGCISGTARETCSLPSGVSVLQLGFPNPTPTLRRRRRAISRWFKRSVLFERGSSAEA